MPDTYGTWAGYQTYCTARDLDIAGQDATSFAKDSLIASEWLDAVYRSGFGGRKVDGRDQVREWPRAGAIDQYGYAILSTSVPTEIENAAYEATRRNAVTPGSLSVDYTPPKYKRASVEGALAVEYAMFDSARDAQTRFTIIDQILAPILTSPSAGMSGYAGYSVRA